MVEVSLIAALIAVVCIPSLSFLGEETSETIDYSAAAMKCTRLGGGENGLHPGSRNFKAFCVREGFIEAPPSVAM